MPEKKSVYRIVIHETNLEEFEIQAQAYYDARGKWQKIYDRRTNKEQEGCYDSRDKAGRAPNNGGRCTPPKKCVGREWDS